MTFRPINIAERLEYFTVKGDGCWLWSGSHHRQGYARIWHNGDRYAHRVWYEITKGAVPDGMCLDHLCRNPGCVNPDHLEPVSNAENVRRGRAGALKPPRLDCRFGHGAPFTDAHGRPRCRVCHNQRQREYNARKAAIRRK